MTVATLRKATAPESVIPRPAKPGRKGNQKHPSPALLLGGLRLARTTPFAVISGLQGIDNAEIIETVHARRQPMVPVRTSLPH